MPAANAHRYKKQFRVKVGNSYCELNFELHEKGVLVPKSIDIGLADIAIFTSIQSVMACIKRTIILQNQVAKGMYSDWPKFAALKFIGTPMPEEFFTLTNGNESQPAGG